MKKQKMSQIMLVVAMVCIVISPVFAQRRSSAAGVTAREARDEIMIDRMAKPGSIPLMRYPEYQASTSGKGTLEQGLSDSKKREWALYEVTYSTNTQKKENKDARGIGWIDELTFTYHIMTEGKRVEKDGSIVKAYSYYSLAVRYRDIQNGKHRSCVCLPPNQTARYGDKTVAVGLVVMDKDGKEAAPIQSERTITLPEKWWEDNKTLDNPLLTRRQGLMDRSKTPFALINCGDYEVVQ